MFTREFDLVVERFTGRDNTSTERETYSDASAVAGAVINTAKELDSVVSGLEGFGEGICVLEATDHECAEESPACRENEYEGGRRWIVRRLEEMEDGESEGFTAGRENWVSITVAVRESN